jgi:hypothetical protein
VSESMATIPVEKEILEDLINSKLNQLTQKINTILSKWDYTSIEKFLKHAADGTLQEAEMDAISLTNLVERKDFYMKYRSEWSSKD